MADNQPLTDDYGIDLPEYLRHARVLAAISPELPQKMAEMATVGHSMSNDLPANAAYQKTLQEPVPVNKPSKLRSILSNIAGIGIGIAGNPALGQYVHDTANKTPEYKAQIKDYKNRISQQGTAADEELKSYKDITDRQKADAEINRDTTQSNLNNYRALGEPYTLKLKGGQTIQGARQSSNGFLGPDGKIVDNGLIDNAYKVGTEPRPAQQSSDPLSLYIRAQGILNDPQTSPDIKKGAQKTVDNFLNSNKLLNLDAQTKIWVEDTIAKHDEDPTSVPEHEYQAALDLKKGTKSASEPVEQVMENGKRIYRPRSESVGKEAPVPTSPIGPTLYVPGDNGGYKVISAKPGAQIPANAQTAAGVNSSNTDTSATKTMREAAPKVLALADKVSKGVDSQEKALGPAAGRWAEFMAGKVGAPNPEFTKLRTDTMLLQTLLMRMHVGSRGGEAMMEHFKNLIDVAGQSPENLRAALGEIKDYANTVAHSGSNNTVEGTTPQVTHRYNPKTGTVDLVQPVAK